MKAKASAKSVSLPRSFLTSAKTDAEGAFAYILVSSLGVPMSSIVATANEIAKNNDGAVAMLCFAASGQIRENLAFADVKSLQLKEKYPALIIDSERDVDDELNFKALHAVGHLLISAVTDPLAMSIKAKVGNCVVGGPFPDTAAGKINSEIYAKWTADEKTLAAKFKENKAVVDFFEKVIAGARTKASEFSKPKDEPKGKAAGSSG